jgi:hypothetical protein
MITVVPVPLSNEDINAHDHLKLQHTCNASPALNTNFDPASLEDEALLLAEEFLPLKTYSDLLSLVRAFNARVLLEPVAKRHSWDMALGSARGKFDATGSIYYLWCLASGTTRRRVPVTRDPKTLTPPVKKVTIHVLAQRTQEQLDPATCAPIYLYPETRAALEKMSRSSRQLQ